MIMSELSYHSFHRRNGNACCASDSLTGITCPDPGVPVDGRRLPLFGVFLPGQAATFSCGVGFRLQGRESLTCGADGQWDDVPPTCEGWFECECGNWT